MDRRTDGRRRIRAHFALAPVGSKTSAWKGQVITNIHVTPYVSVNEQILQNTDLVETYNKFSHVRQQWTNFTNLEGVDLL